MKKHKKVVIISLILVLAGALAWWYVAGQSQNSQIADSTPVNGINYEPPTDEEKAAGDEQKEQNEQDEAQRNNPNNQNKQSASVIITDAGQYDNVIEVRAFVPDHYEDGTCTITFTQGSQTVSKQSPAYRDVSTTICTNPLIERAEFAQPGEWILTVRYDSASATGTSTSKVTIE